MFMVENKEKSRIEKGIRLQLYGWILFVVCALLFIAASVIDRQPLALAGSLVFLLACLFFLIPLVDSLRRGKGKGNG